MPGNVSTDKYIIHMNSSTTTLPQLVTDEAQTAGI